MSTDGLKPKNIEQIHKQFEKLGEMRKFKYIPPKSNHQGKLWIIYEQQEDLEKALQEFSLKGPNELNKFPE